MLAQTFKTAKELLINDRQLEALKKTLVLLETGKIKHDSKVDAFTPLSFNMANWNLLTPCGTVCCIGGTAELVGDLTLEDNFECASCNNKSLEDLFYPENIGGYTYDDITIEQAAHALRSYLTTGTPDWSILKEARNG